MNEAEIFAEITEIEIMHQGGKDLGNGMFSAEVSRVHLSPKKLAAFLAKHLPLENK